MYPNGRAACARMFHSCVIVYTIYKKMQAPEETSPNTVLFVITKSNWGGAQRYTYDLASGFAAQGLRVEVALGGTGTREASPGLLAESLRAASIPVHVVRHFMRDMALFSDTLAFFELVRIIRSVRPDVLHVTSSKAGGLGALAGRLCRVPRIVFTSHGLAYDEDWRPRWQRGLIALFTWLTFFFSHAVILISRDSYERAHTLPLVGRKSVLVHNGIGADALLAKEDARHALARAKVELEACTAHHWVGVIAELHPNKRLSLALEAFAALPPGLSACLVLIGGGQEQQTLMERSRALGIAERVHFLGYVPDAGRFMSAFDLFLMTSRKEGLPYVLLEALAAGVPAVAVSVGGVPDVVEDGVTGVCVGSPAPEISAALERLLKDETMRARMSAASQARAHELFSLTRMRDATLEVYDVNDTNS